MWNTCSRHKGQESIHNMTQRFERQEACESMMMLSTQWLSKLYAQPFLSSPRAQKTGRRPALVAAGAFPWCHQLLPEWAWCTGAARLQKGLSGPTEHQVQQAIEWPLQRITAY